MNAVNTAGREKFGGPPPPKSHTPGAWTSEGEQQKCDRNEWKCKSFHSHGEYFLLSLLGWTCTGVQHMVRIGKAKKTKNDFAYFQKQLRPSVRSWPESKFVNELMKRATCLFSCPLHNWTVSSNVTSCFRCVHTDKLIQRMKGFPKCSGSNESKHAVQVRLFPYKQGCTFFGFLEREKKNLVKGGQCFVTR